MIDPKLQKGGGGMIDIASKNSPARSEYAQTWVDAVSIMSALMTIDALLLLRLLRIVLCLGVARAVHAAMSIYGFGYW